jgi:hypothetical protein
MAVNMRHPLYLTHLKDYVMRDASGAAQHSFKIDWDHDGLGDAAHAYISLVPPALREILVAAIDRLVADYGIDAVFLDETCNVFYNDPAWDQVDGVRRLVRDIRGRHPSLLVAGEEWNEMLLGLTPLVQTAARASAARSRRWCGSGRRASCEAAAISRWPRPTARPGCTSGPTSRGSTSAKTSRFICRHCR